MATTEKKQIVLDVDPDIAERFENASESEKYKIKLWFGLYFREPKSNLERLLADFILNKDQQSFFLNEDGSWNKEALDAVSDEAEDRGLTPEILEEILNEE